MGHRPLHHGDDGAGIHPAGQEGTKGYFGHEPLAGGVVQKMEKCLHGVPARSGVQGARARFPVWGFAQGTGRPRFPDEAMAGADLPDGADCGARREGIAEGEVGLEGGWIEITRDVGVAQDGFEFAAEQESTDRFGVEERFLANPVAGEEGPTAARIPDAEGEHAGKAVDAIVPVFLVEMEDHFGVGVGAEPMAGGLEAGTQVEGVVDLSVEDDPDGVVLVRHRLLATGEVDDGKALHADGDAVVDERTILVGATVVDGLFHAFEED